MRVDFGVGLPQGAMCCQTSQGNCFALCACVICSDGGDNIEDHVENYARSRQGGLDDTGAAVTFVGMCETEVSPLCPSGWAFYSDADGSEGTQSCVWVSTATAATWTAASTSCPSGGHLLTVKSSVAAGGLLAFAVSLVQADTLVRIGCSQSSTATQRGSDWTWVDSTDASNLVCGDGTGCGLWAEFEPE
jgi:hypothetical protein